MVEQSERLCVRMACEVKLPWYVDLLNINLENQILTEAKRRIHLLAEAFRRDGTRINENLDFGA